ncbi:hypothetical protein [Photobacterium halotolerans]|uniref:hypothetical protein n=1 Tax=Photobacterium halotolerans TaxID=265726 RepID=UPI000423C036|nr:hypothetical protein [Photobacterium halotolerans]
MNMKEMRSLTQILGSECAEFTVASMNKCGIKDWDMDAVAFADAVYSMQHIPEKHGAKVRWAGARYGLNDERTAAQIQVMAIYERDGEVIGALASQATITHHNGQKYKNTKIAIMRLDGSDGDFMSKQEAKKIIGSIVRTAMRPLLRMAEEEGDYDALAKIISEKPAIVH